MRVSLKIFLLLALGAGALAAIVIKASRDAADSEDYGLVRAWVDSNEGKLTWNVDGTYNIIAITPHYGEMPRLSLDVLLSARRLSHLELNRKQIDGFLPVESLPRFRKLVLHNCKVLNSHAIGRISGLRSLILTGTTIERSWHEILSDLRKNVQLEVLDLSGCSVSDIESLRGFESLRELRLSRTKVMDFSPLSTLPNLQVLVVRGTQMKTLKHLAGLTKLEVLDLRFTQVRNLRPLVDLKSLQELVVPTELPKSETDFLSRRLPMCKIIRVGR